MEIADMRLAVQDGVATALAEFDSPAIRMLRIDPFDAVDGDDRPVRVVGVLAAGDALDFICIVDDDSEIYPVREGSVWRAPIQASPPVTA